MVGRCEVRAGALCGVERSGREVDTKEDAVPQHNVLWTDALHGDGHKFGATAKGLLTDVLNTQRQFYGGESQTTVEGVRLNAADACRQHLIRQHAATCEGIFSYCRESVGQRKGLQCAAVLEGSCTDSSQGFRQFDGGQTSASAESIIVNSGQSREVVEFFKSGDTLSLEGRAKILDGSSLTIGEYAVSIGIECFDAEPFGNGVADRHFLLGIVLRLAADDGSLALAVAAARSADALGTGIQFRYQVVAVAGTSPAPVDVVAIVSVISVAHEGMTSLAIVTTEIEGAALCQFAVEKVVPGLFAV